MKLQKEFDHLISEESDLKSEIGRLQEDNETYEEYIENLIGRL